MPGATVTVAPGRADSTADSIDAYSQPEGQTVQVGPVGVEAPPPPLFFFLRLEVLRAQREVPSALAIQRPEQHSSPMAHCMPALRQVGGIWTRASA